MLIPEDLLLHLLDDETGRAAAAVKDSVQAAQMAAGVAASSSG